MSGPKYRNEALAGHRPEFFRGQRGAILQLVLEHREEIPSRFAEGGK